ncbi:MAG: SBBP repeat-containing protein, partial [SAR324 cluster bacterium]|nr:SBBP repeat-containing protein [SAR324 cluster bacterium]
GTSTYDLGASVTVDSSDNIYVTGYTDGGLDGNIPLGNIDIFLVKYNSSGVKQWTKQLGTSEIDFGSGLTVDSSDNVYVTGFTAGGLDGNINIGTNDIFLVKYYDNGTKQWTKQLGTSEIDSGNAVTVDSSDNIYVTGNTKGSLDGNIHLGNKDIFLVKYNSSGVKQWTQQLGTSEEDSGAGVTVDSSDNIYVTGHTKGSLDGYTNSGGSDIFLVKYYDNGTKQWTKQLGTSEYDSANGVTVDSSDNIYVTGSTNGGLDGNTHSGRHDIFLLKYNSSGIKK